MTREEAERVLRGVPRMTDYAEGMLGDAEGEYVRLDDVLRALEAVPSGEEQENTIQILQDGWRSLEARAEKAEAELVVLKSLQDTALILARGEPARLREAFVAGVRWYGGWRVLPEPSNAEAARRYPDAPVQVEGIKECDEDGNPFSPLMRCEAHNSCPNSDCSALEPHKHSEGCPMECAISGFNAVCKPVKWKPAEEVLERLRDLPLPEDDILAGIDPKMYLTLGNGDKIDVLRTLARRIEERCRKERLNERKVILDEIITLNKLVATLEGKKP